MPRLESFDDSQRDRLLELAASVFAERKKKRPGYTQQTFAADLSRAVARSEPWHQTTAGKLVKRKMSHMADDLARAICALAGTTPERFLGIEERDIPDALLREAIDSWRAEPDFDDSVVQFAIGRALRGERRTKLAWVDFMRRAKQLLDVAFPGA